MEKLKLYKGKIVELVILFFILIYSFQNIYPQGLEVWIIGFHGKAYISSVNGEKTALIDSLTSDSNGNFNYNISKKKPDDGLYRFSFDKNKFLDFIYDGKDVAISTNINDVLDSLKVLKSQSNKLFYTFLKLNRAYKTKTELLQFILARYPKEDDFYKATQDKYANLLQEYLRFVDTTSQKYPDSFAARYIKSSQLPVVNYNLAPEKQLEYLKAHALDNINFRDGELTFSDLFTNKTIEYLTYYRNPQLPKELLEKEFIKAIDTLLNKAKVNIRVYKQILEYLIDGFKKFGFEEDVEYVVKNYVVKDDICLDNKTETSIENMINQMKILHIGAVAPNIVMKDTSGKIINLDKIMSDKILILFYASWCPHCKKLVPELVKYFNNLKVNDIKIMAVSLDNNRNDWINFIKDNNMNLTDMQTGWINVHSDKGWDCKASHDYYIYATPTMFLVDKDKKIIGIPLSVEELGKLL